MSSIASSFIDAAQRMKTLTGSESHAEWDKIVIMGQQIAADHELFSGVSAEGVTKAVDLSFEGGMEEANELDMDFAGTPDDSSSDVIDLGADDDDDVVDLGMAAEEVVADETGQVLIPPDSGSGIDFLMDEDQPDIEASVTQEMPSAETDETAEMPATPPEDAETTQVASDDSVQTPTIEEQFQMEATSEMPVVSDAEEAQVAPSEESTAEIDLDDLGLDLDELEDTSMADDDASLGDLDDTATSEQLEVSEDDLDSTGTSEALAEQDALEPTGTNEAIVEEDLEETSSREGVDLDEVAAGDATEIASLDDDLGAITQALSDDEATQMAPVVDISEDTDIGIDTDVGLDTSLLDATGQTQILTEDMAVETGTSIEANLSDLDETMPTPGIDEPEPADSLADDAATMLAPMDDDDDGDFDFAKTEALPKDVFSPDMATDDTGRMPGLTGSTDMDLDLDDLTAALKVSEVGDTVNQLRDDATVEQPRIKQPDAADSSDAATQSLSPDDMSGDLHEARTMTEVGTKLDLARAYVDMGDPAGAKSILEEVLDEGDEAQKQQAQQLIESLPT